MPNVNSIAVEKLIQSFNYQGMPDQDFYFRAKLDLRTNKELHLSLPIPLPTAAPSYCYQSCVNLCPLFACLTSSYPSSSSLLPSQNFQLPQCISAVAFLECNYLSRVHQGENFILGSTKSLVPLPQENGRALNGCI